MTKIIKCFFVEVTLFNLLATSRILPDVILGPCFVDEGRVLLSGLR